jgi:hypothetical protein
MGLLVEEAADGFLKRTGDERGEGIADFMLGEAFFAGAGEGGAGGQDPREGIGETTGGVIETGQAPERGADGGAERSEDGGEGLAENVEEFAFGTAFRGRNGR